ARSIASEVLASSFTQGEGDGGHTVTSAEFGLTFWIRKARPPRAQRSAGPQQSARRPAQGRRAPHFPPPGTPADPVPPASLRRAPAGPEKGALLLRPVLRLSRDRKSTRLTPVT